MKLIRNIPTLVLLIFLMSSQLFAQSTQIERSVISTSGGSNQSTSIDISYTVGEPAVITSQANSIIITEGFEQPIDYYSTVSFTIRIQNASCIGKRNGRAFIENLRGCSSPYQINWSAGFNPSDSASTVGLLAGDYSVQVVSADGCNETVPFTIGLVDDSPCLLKFYSGITPNNDGINDSWIIENIDVFPKNEVHIYNRLGNRVWTGVDYDNDNTLWKGQNLSGNNLPSDTYFYVFEANGEVEKGWIELTR